MVEETLRKDIIDTGMALRDKCRDNGINCALFIEFNENNPEDADRELVRMSLHNFYSVGGALSPVLDEIMCAYSRAQAESDTLAMGSIPFMELEGSETN